MKISELKFDEVCKILNKKKFSMHCNESGRLMNIIGEKMS